MKRSRVGLLGFLFLFLSIGFFLYGTMLPIGIHVRLLKSDIYEDTKLTKSDLSVEAFTLFGNTYSVSDFIMKPAKYNTSVDVYFRGFHRNVNVDSMSVKEFQTSYAGTCYAGDKLDKSLIHVTAIYFDGRTKELTDFSVEPIVFGITACDIPIVTDLGDTCLSVTPEQPVDMIATYEGSVAVGDAFDENQLLVQLVFSDGERRRLSGFVVSGATEYISGDMILSIDTDYGATTCVIEPIKVESLSAVYNGSLYVGDEIDKNQISFTATMDGGDEVSITEFMYDNPGYLKTDTDIQLKSRYGESVLHVEPIKVKDVSADVDSNLTEGDSLSVNSVSLVFEDDTVRDLSIEDIVFTNLPEQLADGETEIWFTYRGSSYSFCVTAIPSSVASMRAVGASDGVYTRYDLTDAQLAELCIVCQKVSADDVVLAAAEASLMANRYELYGVSDSSDGASFVSYVESSGYWGSDLQSYVSGYEVNEDVMLVVRDVLVNGNRVLPLYVDERDLRSDIIRNATNGVIEMYANGSSFVENNTILESRRGVLYLYYRSVSDAVFGYTSEAWNQVCGTTIPPIVMPNDSLLDAADDGITIVNLN